MAPTEKPRDQVGVRELRQNLSVYLERVQAGETLRVTDRGRPVALLTPLPPPSRHWMEDLIAAGKATAPKGDLLEFLREHPPLPPAAPGEQTLSEILQELREERLP